MQDKNPSDPAPGRDTGPSAAPLPFDFGERFRESFRVLWLIAAGIVREPALAEDVVQDAAMIALRKLDQFEPESSFRAWMGQIVRNTALNQSRKTRRRREKALDAAAEPAAPNRAPSSDAAAHALAAGGDLPEDQTWFDDDVMQALTAVGETARSCLMLRTIEGLTFSEISSLLDIPEGTAMSHVHRSRRLLRERLAPGTAGSAAVEGGDA